MLRKLGFSSTLASVWNWSSGDKTIKLMLNVNMNYYSGIDADNFDGEGSGTSGFLDRTFAHEFTHAVMATNISYFNSLPKFIKEGMAELTHGIDDFRPTNIFKIAYDADWLDASLDLDNKGTGLQNIGDGYSGGYMFLRYFAKQAALQSIADDLESFNPLLITLTENADTYSNSLASATIMALAGNDKITNKGASVSIDGAEGNDYFYSQAVNVTINGGDGADTIYNPAAGSNVTIDGGAGNDYIRNSGSKSTISGGDGSDTIYVYYTGTGDTVSVSGGAGNDSIVNSSAYHITIEGGEGADTVSSNGCYISINGGEGADNISVSGSYITVDGGAGNDSIFNNATSNVTINTAQGNDTIRLSSSAKSFKAEGFGAGDVIQLYSAATKLETISGGIKAGNVSISGVEGIATVNNSWSTSTNSIAYNQSTVAGAKLSNKTITYDTLSGTENLFTISGIKSTTGVSLNGKEITLNNAALSGSTGTVSISGGDYKLKLAGDVDTIAEDNTGWTTLKSGNVAYLEGGKGSYYSLASDGKSITYNEAVAGTNKVEFGGVKGTPTISGNTVSLTANNFNGNVSVASNAGNYQFALSGAFGGKKFTGTSKVDTITNSGSKITITGGAGNDIITNSGSNVTITGDAGNDKVTNSGSNVSVNGGAGNDTFTAGGSNVTLTGGAGNDVFAHSTGSLKITDYTASADKISLDIAGVQDVALNNNDVTLNLGQSDAVTIVGGKDKKITVAKNKAAQYIFNDHVILNTGKTSASLVPAATNFNATSYSAMVTVDGAKTNSAVQIVGNTKANKIYAGAKGSTLNGGTGNDTLYGGAGVDVFVYANKTGNDVIQNYTSGKDKISLTSGASLAGFSVNDSGDAVLKIGSNNLTIKKADGENIADNGKKITIIDAAGKETTGTYFTNRTVSGNGVTLNAEYTNSFTASSSIVTVDATQNSNPLFLKGNAKNNILMGGDGNDTLSGGSGNDKLYGQNGNDSLIGGKGNDSLWGGDGKDVFIYEAGKDVIADFTAGQDKIKIASGKISKSTLSDSDVVFTIGKGSLTVKNAKGKTISLVDSSNKASSTVVGAQTLTNSNKASVTIGADMGAVDSSSRTKAISITGNALANTISGGTKNDSLFGAAGNDSIVGNAGNDKLYGDAGNDILLGGKGNDSLWGGAGNDSLWGDAGNDTFIYTANEGTDKIFDYETGDLLKILNADGSNGSFKSSKYSGGDLTLTINGGGKIIFEDVASSTKFNINGSSYIISGSKLLKK